MDIKPTESELAILQVLWAKGPSTVRTVNEFLNTQREVGYTTTLKLLQIMHEKGLVTRQEEGKTHIYTAALGESDTQSALLGNFIQTAFRGSGMRLVMQALGNEENPSQAELDELKALIASLEKNQGT